MPSTVLEGSGNNLLASPTATTGAQVGYNRSAFIGSCKHHVWQAIRASSAAPYYLDDYSDGIIMCLLNVTEVAALYITPQQCLFSILLYLLFHTV